MRDLIKYSFLFLSLFCISGLSRADTIISIKIDDGSIISGGFEILRDENGNLHPSKVLHGNFDEQFKLLPNTNLGFTKGITWIKFILKNDLNSAGQFLIHLPYPLFYDLRFYSPLDGDYSDGDFGINYSGINYSSKVKAIRHRNSLFPIHLKFGETKTCFFRIENLGTPVDLNTELWTPEKFYLNDASRNFIYGIYYGLIILVFIINLFLYFSLKEKVYVLYVAYVLGLLIIQLILYGYFYDFMPDNTWLKMRVTTLVIPLSMLFLLRFTQEFLDTKNLIPRSNLWFNFIIFFGLILGVVSCFDLLWLEAVLLLNLQVALSSFFIFIIAFVAFKKGCGPATYFLTAFSVLIIAVITYLAKNLGLLEDNWFVLYGMQIGTLIEIITLTFGLTVKFKREKMEKEKAQSILVSQLQEMNRIKDEANIRLEQQVRERTLELNEKKEILEELYKDVKDSINYAQKIQRAILPDEGEIQNQFKESFILYKPKDIVSGDFYYYNQLTTSEGNFDIIAAADCTGHGVPGALMSMIGATSLNEVIKESTTIDPALLLNKVHKAVKTTLKQHELQSGKDSKDGMDIALCAINSERNVIYYSGAQRPLYLIRNGTDQIEEFKANKYSIGGAHSDDEINFTSKRIEIEKGDRMYIFSDGYPDQFGGPSGKKFMSRQFKDLLLSISSMNMEHQYQKVHDTFENWKSQLTQVDDVLVIGIKF